MSKRKASSTAPAKKPNLQLWKLPSRIQEMVEKISILTLEIFPRGRERLILAEAKDDCPGDPFEGVDAGLLLLAHVNDGKQFLYRVDDTYGPNERWHSYLLNVDYDDPNSRVKWAQRVRPPNWALDLPRDILIHIASYLPIPKVFIVAGLCTRFRSCLFGVPDPENPGRLKNGGFRWRDHLSYLASSQVTPRYPKSVTGFTKADKLSSTDLSRWGGFVENSIRSRGAPAVEWPPRDPIPEGQTRPPLSDAEARDIHVMYGDMGRCETYKIFSSTTFEQLEAKILEEKPEPGGPARMTTNAAFKRKLKRARLWFFVECPPKEVLMTLSDDEFKRMGLDLPTRNKDTGEIEHLPLLQEMIPWTPETPIHFYRAMEEWRVNVKVFHRRAMAESDNEALRHTVISRFSESRYCKHCCRQMDPRETRCRVPAAWTDMVPGIEPICIHCFTHRHAESISSPTAATEPVRCPKCQQQLSNARNTGARSKRELDTGNYNYFWCQSRQCNELPMLYFAFNRKEIRFTPHIDAWKRECLGQPPVDTDAIRLAKEAKKRRRIEALQLEIQRNYDRIEQSMRELDTLGGSDHRKKPKHRVAGKQPPPTFAPGKKPMMSPVLTGKRPREPGDEEDDDDDDDEEDE